MSGQMLTKGRDRSLDMAKGIAIFLVMVGHVINLNHMEDPVIYDCIRAVQMPLFMIVSGLLCGRGRQTSDFGSYFSVIKKRAVSYLLPFFMWIVVIYPLQLPGAFLDTLNHLDYGLWFLMTLFVLTFMVYTAQLIAGLLCGLFSQEKENNTDCGKKILREVSFWGAYGVLAIILQLQVMKGVTFLSPELTRLYLPFYMVGYVISHYGISKKMEQHKALMNVTAAAAGVLLMVMAFLFDLRAMVTFPELARQIAASFLGSYAILRLCGILCGRISKREKAPDKKLFGRWSSLSDVFIWLGGYTLEIYALHFHFATLLGRGESYSLYSVRGLLFAVASFIVMSVITAAIIVITKKIPLLDLLLYGKRRKVNAV